MTRTLAQIWRHPIKAHGTETLEATDIRKGETLPFDRLWAVRHEASKAETGAWSRCSNFTRGASAPHLMAIGARVAPDGETLTLTHPDQPDLTFSPDDPAQLDRFLAWIGPLMPKDRAAPKDILRATEQGMTDVGFPSISLGNLASLRALEQAAGQTLDPRRFRINLWMDGLTPFEEFDWLEQKLSIGDVPFAVEERITRCKSITANPDTGQRDIDLLGILESAWGHTDFGMNLIAQEDGRIATGDAVRLQ